jgi:hypothetical protein
MVVGHGDIASVLTDKEGFTFFAKGVSNSLTINPADFMREKRQFDLASNMHPNNRFVYFSTLSIYDTVTPYTLHKREMEGLVKSLDKYCIIRIGNITWGKNPHTIINTFKRQIANNEPSRIEDRYKYLVSKTEFLYWIDLIPNFNTEMSITGEKVSIQEIYQRCKYNLL